MKKISVLKVASVVALMAAPGFQSQALIIGFNAQETGLQSICYLGGHNTDNSMTYRCSGTLISPTEILTAGHCATPLEAKDMHVEVACGFQGSRSPALMSEFEHLLGHTTESPGVFKEVLPVSTVEVNNKYTDKMGDSDLDYAIVHLSKASRLPYLSVLNPDQTNALLTHLNDKKTTIQCIGTGFGVDAQNNVGALRSGDLTNVIKFAESNVLVAQQMTKLTSFLDMARWLALESKDNSESQVKEALLLSKEHALPVSLMPGDSGGPLLCRANSQDSWKIVGVASAVGFKSQGLDKNNSLTIGEEILWAMPDISKTAFVQAWPQ